MTLEELEEAAKRGRRVTEWSRSVGTIRTKVGEGTIEHDLENETYTCVYDGGRRERVELGELYDFTDSEAR